MEYLCTTCCKRKRCNARPLPARERYLSRRIRFVWKESRRLRKPLLILSGKYGLLDPNEKIPWYDQALRATEADKLSRKMAKQLLARHVSNLTFYALPRKMRGWRPYYATIEKACAGLGIALRCKILRGFI